MIGVEIIEHENIKIQNLSECCGDSIEDYGDTVKKIWDKILVENKLKVTWDNVTEYWNSFGMTDTLLEYLNNTIVSMVEKDCPALDSELAREIITSDMRRAVYKAFLSKYNIKSIRVPFKEIKEGNFNEYMKHAEVGYSVENYEEIFESHPDYLAQYIKNNEKTFVEDIDELSMNNSVLHQLLNSPKLTDATKTALIEANAVDYFDDALGNKIVENSHSINKETFLELWNEMPNHLRLKFLSQNINQLKSSEI